MGVYVKNPIKTCRLVETIDHEDSWVDKIGYASLGGEMSTGKE